MSHLLSVWNIYGKSYTSALLTGDRLLATAWEPLKANAVSYGDPAEDFANCGLAALVLLALALDDLYRLCVFAYVI